MIARLVFPALRWSEGEGYRAEGGTIDEALELGVGGFLLFGGTAAAAREITSELVRRAGRPLLFGADLERGAGQQLRGLTSLPPALALGSLGPEVVEEAGRLTAREARAAGIAWIFAPVADLACEPRNPIVSTRAFAREAEAAARGVEAWTRGALDGGGIPCLKHFPGHGRTTQDSHATLPIVEADAATLEADLVPFRAGIAAGAPSVMTAHVAYPAFDPSKAPATRSHAILDGRLRQEMDFQGVIATDALIMEGAGEAVDTAVRAVTAGVDALLYPPDVGAMVAGLREALEEGRITSERIGAASTRLDTLLGSLQEASGLPAGPDERALDWADASLVVPPNWPAHHGRVELMTVDDDTGGPYPAEARDTLTRALEEGGVTLVDGYAADTRIVAVFADPRGWKGHAGLSETGRRRARDLVAGAGSRPTGVVLFGDPAWSSDLPSGVPVLNAWGGEPLMQAAAGARIAGLRDG